MIKFKNILTEGYGLETKYEVIKKRIRGPIYSLKTLLKKSARRNNKTPPLILARTPLNSSFL